MMVLQMKSLGSSTFNSTAALNFSIMTGYRKRLQTKTQFILSYNKIRNTLCSLKYEVKCVKATTKITHTAKVCIGFPKCHPFRKSKIYSTSNPIIIWETTRIAGFVRKIELL